MKRFLHLLRRLFDKPANHCSDWDSDIPPAGAIRRAPDWEC